MAFYTQEGCPGEMNAEEILDIEDDLVNNVEISELTLGYNLDSLGARAIAAGLNKTKTLTYLDIPLNENIGVRGWRAIADALKNNTSITTLHLFQNDICDEGMEMIAKALKMNKALKTVNLGNSVGNNNVRAFAEILRYNTTLRSLDLSLSDSSLIIIKIDAHGARALGDALKKNSTLTSLDLSGHAIGVQGALAFAEVLDTNRTLQILSVPDTTADIKNVIDDRLALNMIISLKYTDWIDAVRASNTILSRQANTTSEIIKQIIFHAFGDELLDGIKWKSPDGRQFASRVLLEKFMTNTEFSVQ